MKLEVAVETFSSTRCIGLNELRWLIRPLPFLFIIVHGFVEYKENSTVRRRFNESFIWLRGWCFRSEMASMHVLNDVWTDRFISLFICSVVSDNKYVTDNAVINVLYKTCFPSHPDSYVFSRSKPSFHHFLSVSRYTNTSNTQFPSTHLDKGPCFARSWSHPLKYCFN